MLNGWRILILLCVRRLKARFLMRMTVSMLCSNSSSISEASTCG